MHGLGVHSVIEAVGTQEARPAQFETPPARQ